MMHYEKRKLIEGQPVLVVIDIQGGASEGDEPSTMPFMPDYQIQLVPLRASPEVIARPD